MRVTMDDIRDSDMEVAVEQPNDKGENEPTPDTSQKDKDMLTVEDIREQLKLIERGVLQKESRYIIRAVRSIQKLRKHVNDNVLWKSISNLPPGK
jgi:26S proteasome regulatory subunit N3